MNGRRSLRVLRGIGALALLAIADSSARPPVAHAQPEPNCFEIPRGTLSRGTDADTCWYSIHVHAVKVTDTCAGQRAAGITPLQVAAWIAKANEVYAAARVRFEFDPTPDKGDWSELHSTEVNSIFAHLPGDERWERAKSIANDFAARFPQKIVVFFRHGPDAGPTGGGFSSTAYNFVVMPGFAATVVCNGAQNITLLAHELGHYLGLSHTFREFKKRGEAAAAFRAAGNKPDFFDGDGLPETPPEAYIEELSCGPDALVILNGIPFPFLRKNIMSYYPGAPKSLTPKQASIVRATIERRFSTPLGRVGPYVPDPRRVYQIMSLANGKSLEVENASKENGARVRPADWKGTPNQKWTFVPMIATDAGSFEIVSVATGKCLTIDDGSLADGARLVQSDWFANGNQKWRLTRDAAGDLWIEAKHSRKVLGLAAAVAGARAASPGIEQSADKGEPRQRWRLLPAD